MDDAKKKAVFEQLKIELRSILLSSKEGVPEHLILSDYEMLSCQRLPYKNLGYSSVSALLGDMPDVAKPIRLGSGDTVYKAVSNESTAHIQRLVGNQKSAKKRPGRGRGGIRGRGGTFSRGMSRGGRGGRGGSFRGSFTSRFSNSDRGRGGSFAPRGVKPRGFGSSRGMFRSSDTSFAGDVRGSLNNNVPSKGFRSTINSGFTGDVRNRDGNLPSNKYGSKFRHDSRDNKEEDYQPGLKGSPVKQSSPESKQQTSPMFNLKIGISSDGQRKIVTGSPLKSPKNYTASSEIDAVTRGGQVDIRGWLQEQKQVKVKKNTDNTHSSSNPVSTPSRKKMAKRFFERYLLSVVKSNKKKKGSPPFATNHDEFKRNLPPRFVKQQQQKSSQKNHNGEGDGAPKFLKEETPPLQEQRAMHTITSNNWEPPENGSLYLETYYKYFADRGEQAPPIKVTLGKVNREKGFYGQLHHEEICHFPLEIMKTEEHARQNAARCFCINKKIPLLTTQNPGADYLKFASSEPSGQPCPQPTWMASLTQQLRGSIDLGPAGKQQPSTRPAAGLSQTNPGPVAQTQTTMQKSVSFTGDLHVAKKIEKIYKMLQPAGVFIKSLPELYQKTYKESLDLDALPHLQARTDCFSLEEAIPGRIVVCPVPGAEMISEFNNNSTASSGNVAPPPALVSPPSSSHSGNSSRPELQDCEGDTRLQLLEKGSELEVIFSYAYSTSEVYFQLALSEDIIYEIEEVLNQVCAAPAPPDWVLPEVGSFVAAMYEEGWYRAQILESNIPKVQVYFIDYGNRETVDTSDLRPLPENEVTQLTPPLALRCALSPGQASHFQVDTHTRLEELATENHVLKAVVLDNSDACVVELQLKDGTPVVSNSMPDNVEEVKQQATNTLDPDKLLVPDVEAFPAYICQVRTECSVLLRVVDEEYSDALDKLENIIAENFYSWPVPVEVKERHIYAAMVLATAEEAQDESSLDQNKYHRVRVERKMKDGSYTCYLPDHSDEELLQRTHLREIDPELNRSLPYQAVLATLHGLDQVEETLKPTAMEILLKLINFTMPVYAIRRTSQALDIDIVDNNNEEEVNVNESVLAALEEVRESLSQGKSLKDIMHTMFGSTSGSQADSSSLTSPSAATEEDTEDVQAALGRLSVTGEGDEAQTKLSRVQDYVDDLPETAGTKLYTWNSNSGPVSPATPQAKGLPPLPGYWPYPFLTSVSLYITWAESPSYFVAIPLEQQGALEKVEAAMAQYFSSSVSSAENLSEQGLYAVKSEGKYRRAMYMGLVGGMAKVFFPDHHSYDTVEMGEILPLPEQFYSLPFLAYKMRLRAMRPPQFQDWPEKTISWFKENISHKALFAVIFSQDGRPAGSKHTGISKSSIVPATLAVRLIDTGGEEDVIVDELMAEMGLAVNDPSQEQV